jgi:hypothetical protein
VTNYNKRHLVRRYTFALHLFKSYCIHRKDQGNPIGDNWTGITHEDVNDYRIGPDYTLHSLCQPSTTSTATALAPSTPPVTSQRIRDPIADFKKGIKRDSSSFTVYKDEKQWDTWQRSTLAQARAQDVAEILDRTYVPTSSEARDLSRNRSSCMLYSNKHFKRTKERLSSNSMRRISMHRRYTCISRTIRSSPLIVPRYLQASLLHHVSQDWRWHLERHGSEFHFTLE